MKILGAIIAGGQSSRMGGEEKAFLDLGGRPLIAHIGEALQKQTEKIVINANGDPARFAGLGCNILADLPAYRGTPLAGVAAALAYGATQGFDAVVTVPSDTPFLPPDLVARLSAGGAAIASSDGQDHYLTGFWPVSLVATFEDADTKQSLRRMKDFVTLAGANKIEWSASPFDPFFNINTPQELEQANSWLKAHS